jgi:hypothetical protein
MLFRFVFTLLLAAAIAATASYVDGRRESVAERMKRERLERREQRKTGLSLAQREKERKEVDCSIDREQPFEFVLGDGAVMEGWEKGMHGMCVGEKRKLTIPSGLAYGEAGGAATEGRIPPGATLVYEVEVLRINKGRV